ncbi:hypothetical protein GBA52_025019 [Prunus armeniaca]|nr:hypothetical protein GBA52_025019 [Prunus armeniaca]
MIAKTNCTFVGMKFWTTPSILALRLAIFETSNTNCLVVKFSLGVSKVVGVAGKSLDGNKFPPLNSGNANCPPTPSSY